jgi:hypothetical protein
LIEHHSSAGAEPGIHTAPQDRHTVSIGGRALSFCEMASSSTLGSFLLAAALLTVGCGDDLNPVAQSDLSASSDFSRPPDLAVSASSADLDLQWCVDGGATWQNVDIRQFCAGTPIAGTCVQTFFGIIANCFAPAGCCQCSFGINAHCDWPSRSHFDGGGDGVTFSRGGVLCGDYVPFLKAQPFWESPIAGMTLTETGPTELTCPDGTRVDVGMYYSACPALQALVNPDLSSCTRL